MQLWTPMHNRTDRRGSYSMAAAEQAVLYCSRAFSCEPRPSRLFVHVQAHGEPIASAAASSVSRCTERAAAACPWRTHRRGGRTSPPSRSRKSWGGGCSFPSTSIKRGHQGHTEVDHGDPGTLCARPHAHAVRLDITASKAVLVFYLQDVAHLLCERHPVFRLQAADNTGLEG